MSEALLPIELSPTRRFEIESSIEARLLSATLSFVDAVEVAMSMLDPTTAAGLDSLLKIQRVNCSTLQALRSNRATPPRPETLNGDKAIEEGARILAKIDEVIHNRRLTEAANMATAERAANDPRFTTKR